MAAPTIVAALGAHDNLTTNIGTFEWPIPGAAAAGDLAIIMVGMNAGSSNTFPTPAGWTAIGTALNTNNNHNSQAFGKILAQSDLGTTVTTSLATGAGKIHGGGIVIRGAEGVPTNFATVTDTTNGTTVTGPSITTDSIDNLILNAAMMRHQDLVSAKSTTTVGTGWTKRTDTGTANSVQPNFSASLATYNTTPGNGATVSGAVFTPSHTTTMGHVWAFAIEPGVSNTAPSASAGADQNNIEPYSTVTLTGTASDAEGAIASTSWTQVAGLPEVTLSGTGNTRTYRAPGTIDGTTLTFRFSATDSAGATSSDDTNNSILPVTERAAVGGVWVPQEIRTFDNPVDPSLRGLGYIGDGSVYQYGSGAARRSLVSSGWSDTLVTVDGLEDRTIPVDGVTHPNFGEVVDHWRVNNDYDPYTWIVSLGLHNLGASDATWTSLIGGDLDKIAAGPRASYVVNWVGFSLRDPADTRPGRFLSVLNTFAPGGVNARAKITLKPLDWNAHIHNGRDETGLWNDDAAGRFMTPAGYDIFNSFIVAQIGAPV